MKTLARLLACTAALCATLAQAQPYPAKAVKIVVPFGPGGSADTLGRLAATKLTESLGQSFVIENRGGAGGMLGSDIVAKSAPDGYTLVVSGIASHAIGPAMVEKPPFDPMKDFTHIALFGGPPLVLAVNPQVPAKTLKEFIQLLKAKPDTISYGSPGVGTHGHLFAELIKQRQGIQMAHVPYKGAAQAVADLIAGHLQAVSTTLTTAGAQIRAGKAVALAISADKRLPDYPNAPTFRELGHPDLTAVTWFSLSGPAGMPAEVVSRINAETRKGLHQPDARERMRPEGIEPGDLDPKQFTEFVAAEVKRWTPVVKASGAKAE